MTPQFIFLYGTLRLGQGAYRTFGLDKALEHVATTTLPNATMVSLGGFPGVKLTSDGPGVVGDLFRIKDASIINRLDGYEGEGSLYIRQIITLGGGPLSDEPLNAYIYEYNHSIDGRPVVTDWVKARAA